MILLRADSAIRELIQKVLSCSFRRFLPPQGSIFLTKTESRRPFHVLKADRQRCWSSVDWRAMIPTRQARPQARLAMYSVAEAAPTGLLRKHHHHHHLFGDSRTMLRWREGVAWGVSEPAPVDQLLDRQQLRSSKRAAINLKSGFRQLGTRKLMHHPVLGKKKLR